MKPQHHEVITMARKTGVTRQTAKRLILDAGAIYLNWGLPDERLLGATEGGATFTIEQEIREPEIDGLPGPLAGTRRVTSVHPRITARLLEQTTRNILIEIAGSESTVSGDEAHDIITREGWTIPESAHLANVAIVGTVSGSEAPIVCLIKNALVDGAVELNFADESEAGPEVQFTGHFTVDDLQSEPWEIHNPRFTHYTLTYTAGANGTIVGPTPQSVEEGDDGLTVTATPDEGYEFVAWSDGVETAARRDMNVQAAITVTATFEVAGS
jgi:hypothetical protein